MKPLRRLGEWLESKLGAYRTGLEDLTPDIIDAAIASPDPVLVDVGAMWCGPCRHMIPIVQRAASALEGRLRSYSVDVQAHPGMRERFDAKVIPTFVVFRDGAERHRVSGKVSLEQLLHELEAAIA